MTTLEAGVAPIASVAPRAARAALLLTGIGTALVILAAALLPLLTPWFMHPALDAARSADWLGLTQAQTHALSDRAVEELVLGPGTFAFPGPGGQPLFGADEAAHMREARTLLLGFLGAATVGATTAIAVLARSRDRRAVLRAIGRAGALTAVGVAIIGVIGAVAFDPLFELFHRVFFPGGNWAFDPRTSRLVQLYPLAFWEIAAFSLGAIALALGIGTWAIARRRGGRT